MVLLVSGRQEDGGHCSWLQSMWGSAPGLAASLPGVPRMVERCRGRGRAATAGLAIGQLQASAANTRTQAGGQFWYIIKDKSIYLSLQKFSPKKEHARFFKKETFWTLVVDDAMNACKWIYVHVSISFIRYMRKKEERKEHLGSSVPMSTICTLHVGLTAIHCNSLHPWGWSLVPGDGGDIMDRCSNQVSRPGVLSQYIM